MSELYIKQELFKALPQIDALLLDVDGVLLNVDGSFSQVIASVAQYFATQVLKLDDTGPILTTHEVGLFKLAGGFNDDWELCCAAVALIVAKWARDGGTTQTGDNEAIQANAPDTTALRAQSPSWNEYTNELKHRRTAVLATTGLAGAEALVLESLTPPQRREFARTWSTRLVTQLCQEMYGGPMCNALYGFEPQHITSGEHFGLYKTETPLVDVALLNKIHGRVRLGILTGRSETECALALRVLGLQLDEEAQLTASSGLKKPDGKSMMALRDQMAWKSALYVGDTLDDLRTVQNYREVKGSGKSRVLSAIVLSGPGGEAGRRTFLEAGAEVVSSDLNLILQYLDSVLK